MAFLILSTSAAPVGSKAFESQMYSMTARDNNILTSVGCSGCMDWSLDVSKP
jgi:hypothetical protein